MPLEAELLLDELLLTMLLAPLFWLTAEELLLLLELLLWLLELLLESALEP